MLHQANLEKRKNDEYETQYFGTSAKEYAKEVSQIFHESVASGFEGFHKYLCHLKAEASDGHVAPPEDLQKINEITQIALKEFETNVQGIMLTLENYLSESTFRIPEQIVLQEDAAQESYQPGVEAALDHEIAHLLEQLKTLRYLEVSLEHENAEAQELLPQVDRLVHESERVSALSDVLPNTPATHLQQLVDASHAAQTRSLSVLPQMLRQEEEEEEVWGSSDNADTNCTPPSANL